MKKAISYKFIYTLGMILLVRLVAHIPVPWVDAELMQSASTYTFFDFTNLFSGGAFSNFTFGAIGVSSYISATIIFQILAFFISPLRKIQQSAASQNVAKKILMIIGVLVAFISSLIMTFFLNKEYSILIDNSIRVYIVVAICQTLGSIIDIWAGEKIEEQGIGNGLSILIYVNVLASLPSIYSKIRISLNSGELSTQQTLVYVITVLAIFLLSVFYCKVEYRLPIIFASRKEKSKYDSDITYFPIKLHIAGIMPCIFALYVFSATGLIAQWLDNNKYKSVINKINANVWIYSLVYAILIFLFSLVFQKINKDNDHTSYVLAAKNVFLRNINPGIATRNAINKGYKKIFIYGILSLYTISVIPNAIFMLEKISIVSVLSIAVIINTSVDIFEFIKNERSLLKIDRSKLELS